MRRQLKRDDDEVTVRVVYAKCGYCKGTGSVRKRDDKWKQSKNSRYEVNCAMCMGTGQLMKEESK
jgi:DnaJ-class molecular chaperone